MLTAPNELLTTFDRRVRAPLHLIVKHMHSILDALPSPEENPASYCEALASCYNQTSLLELGFGRSKMAYSMCFHELQWINDFARQSGLQGLRVYGFQPWINLARLDRLHGRTDQAWSRLAALLETLETHRANFGTLVISASDWSSLVETIPNLTDILVMVWVCETLLCGLHSHRYDLFDFVDKIIADKVVDSRIALLEARLIAARYLKATAVPHGVCSELENLSLLKRHSLAIRKLELEAVQTPDHAELVAKSTAIATYNLSKEIGCWHLAIVQHCVALLLKLERHAAMPISERAYAAANCLGDEVFSAWFADACIEASNGGKEWIQWRSLLSERSWYARIRLDKNSVQASRLDCIDSLHRRLVSVGTGSQ